MTPYRIEQDFEYVGRDYWRWSAWIEADEGALDQVLKVDWLLHPTFKKSLVRSNDRSTKFRLQSAGWGTFLLRAELHLQGGGQRSLRHNLRLEYPEAQNESAPAKGEAVRSARPLTIFLSYSTEDNRTAAMLRRGLAGAGFIVLDQTQLGDDASPKGSLSGMIARADAVVGLVGDSDISPWVREEMGAAVSSDKPTFALLMPGASGAGLSESVQALRIDSSNIDEGAIQKLLSSVKMA